MGNDDDAKNPLYNLESYKFIKNVIQMNDEQSDRDEEDNTLTIEIPEQYMVRDVIFLLTYLKSLDEDQSENDDPKENDDENIENAQDKDIKMENVKTERVAFVFGA